MVERDPTRNPDVTVRTILTPLTPGPLRLLMVALVLTEEPDRHVRTRHDTREPPVARHSTGKSRGRSSQEREDTSGFTRSETGGSNRQTEMGEVMTGSTGVYWVMTGTGGVPLGPLSLNQAPTPSSVWCPRRLTGRVFDTTLGRNLVVPTERGPGTRGWEVGTRIEARCRVGDDMRLRL